jgi:hypothetical protein
MAVDVDSWRARYGAQMIMCHMVADTLCAWHAMADQIGVSRRWFQSPPKASKPHDDLCLQKRRRASKCGAQDIHWCEMPTYAGKILDDWRVDHS